MIVKVRGIMRFGQNKMGLTKNNLYKKPEVRIEFSFDDGGKDDLKVTELLKKHGFKGTFYVVLDWIGQEGFLNWSDIRRLDNEGFNIGSHTISHPQDLKLLYDEQLHYEVQNSKDMLEMSLGHNITSFCYPRGRMDGRVRNKVVESGYIDARGTGKPGIITIEDKFYLPGTIHIFQRPEYEGKPILDYAKEVLDKIKKEGGYCNVWGHSAEIQKFSLWNTLEEILKYANQE